MRIGNPSCTPWPIIAAGYVGVDNLSPRNNFYYVEVKVALTVGSVLRAFCVKTSLPRPLADSGFPRGFLNSYSLAGKRIDKINLNIPAGYHLKAAINILGLEAHVELTISLLESVKMLIGLGPLNMAGGLFKMYASRNDRSKGPFLKVEVVARPRPKFDMHASGFVSVLGIQVEAMLRITNTKYEYMIAGKFLHLFQARLHITANYGNIKTANFRVQGYLKNDFFATIRRKIQQGLSNSAKAATRAIDSAKRKVNSKKVLFDRAVSKLRGAQNRVNRAKGVFDRAVNKLRSWQRKVNRLCRMKRCSKKCIGCPLGWKCLKRVWGKCVIGRPGWKCCKRFTDPFCKSRNAGCWTLRKAAYAGLKSAEGLVRGARSSLSAANKILDGAKAVVRTAKKSLDIVNAFLEGVKRTYRAGTQAISAIARYSLGGVFDIREASFDVALGVASRGHFRVSLTCTIFKRVKRFSLNINFGSIGSFIKSIGEHIIRGLKNFIS